MLQQNSQLALLENPTEDSFISSMIYFVIWNWKLIISFYADLLPYMDIMC